MSALQLTAVLLFLLGLAHSVLGERFILIRLFRRDNLPKLFGGTDFTTRTLRFAWHITTVTWWALAVMLWHLDGGVADARFLLRTIGLALLAAGALPLLLTRGRHLSWIVLWLVGAVALLQAAR
ncbi:MAG: hypothetical protein Q4F49_00945 [Pseudoxanthomonas suwonensis]|nr:hypothetical protein [Pseudoxanthomonas suwonensis]